MSDPLWLFSFSFALGSITGFLVTAIGGEIHRRKRAQEMVRQLRAGRLRVSDEWRRDRVYRAGQSGDGDAA